MLAFVRYIHDFYKEYKKSFIVYCIKPAVEIFSFHSHKYLLLRLLLDADQTIMRRKEEVKGSREQGLRVQGTSP